MGSGGAFGFLVVLALAAAAVQWGIVYDRRQKALRAPIASGANRPSAKPDPSAIDDGRMRCHHCGGTEFDRREGQINTAAMTFLDMDWANRSAAVLTCQACGYIHWFMPRA
ncbi:MAG: hypothetical protein ACOYXM_13800 [Actinomycetota bacterium]